MRRLRSAAGDSVYFDSGMAHGYVRTSDEPCTVLAVCAGQGIQQLAETAGKRLAPDARRAERAD